MARIRFYSKRPLVVIILALMAWWIIPSIVKSFLRTSFFEFQAPSWTISSHLKDLQDYWTLRSHSEYELIEAGRSLARLNAYYEVNLQENEVLRDEIERLEALLDLPSEQRYNYENARVIRRDLNSWWQQLIIRKGRLHNIPEGAAVIFSGGVVGRIKEVHAYTSVVELISSRSFRMAAHISGDERPVTYQGDVSLAFNQARGQVSNVQIDIKVSHDNPVRLVSSRLGGVFPDGLTVGWIDRLSPSSNGLFQSGQVRLDSRLFSIKEVSVLVPVNPEEIER